MLYVVGGCERGKFFDESDRVIEIYCLTYGNYIFYTDIYEDDEMNIGILNMVLGLIS